MKTTMKSILATLGVFVFATTLAVAQPRKGEHPRELPNAEKIEKMVDHLAIELSLTVDQKTEIKTLYLNHFNEIKEDQQKEKEKNDLLRDEHKKHRNDFFESVKAELNESQIEQFDEFNKKQKGHKQKKQRGENKRPRK